MAQSQFVLIRFLWTLILKVWRPLRVGTSSSFDDGSEFQVLTYLWGNDRGIVAFDCTGRSRESRKELLSESWCLVPGLSTGVSWVGSSAWSVVRRGLLSSLNRRHRALTVRRRARLSMMVPAPISDRVRFWTLSRRPRWQAAAPDHTSGQYYSSTGRMKPLKATVRPWWSRSVKAFLKSPMCWAAPKTVERRCELQLRCRPKLTPKSLTVSTSSTTWPLKLVGGMAQSFLWREITIACDFEGSNWIFHVAPQCARTLTPIWNFWHSVADLADDRVE